jgi:hypothetical protein
MNYQRQLLISITGLVMIFLPGFLVTASAQPEEALNDGVPVSKQVSFKKLWPNQVHLNIAMAGYREVAETDMFNVRRFNPSGPDFTETEQFSVTSRQAYYPVVTIGASAHTIFPVLISNVVRLHVELSGEVFYQKMILPSHTTNVVAAPSHFDVGYYNMPAVTTSSVGAGFWLFEHLSAGARYLWNGYAVRTTDDRVAQRDFILTNHGIIPYAAFWLPLDYNPLSRWNIRGTFDLTLLTQNRKRFLPAVASLEFLHLSLRHTGRVTGFSLTLLQFPEAVDAGGNTGYSIHHDRQFLFGVNIGAGGWNRKGGR